MWELAVPVAIGVTVILVIGLMLRETLPALDA